MSIVFEVEPNDPRYFAAARLHIVCPNHPDELLVDWCMNAVDGGTWIENDRGRTWENVAGAGTHESVLTAAERGMPFALPDAEVSEDDEPHTRERLKCPRPSCGYDAQVRSEKLWPRIRAYLGGMVDAGLREATVTNIDATAWRVVGG